MTASVVTTSVNGLAAATSFATIPYAATVDLDMSVYNGQYRAIALTGNLTLTTSNRAAGRMMAVRLDADSTDRNLTFPSGWKFLSGAPSSLKASESAVLSLTFFGLNDSDCIVAYSSTSTTLGTSSILQLAGLGLGVVPVSGWDLHMNGAVVQNRSTVTISGSTYTLDVQSANEFVTAAPIAGPVIINLSNLSTIPTGFLWRGVLTFSYTSGTITWFSGNSTYQQKWDGVGNTPPMVPTAGDVEKVVIEVVGGTTTIEIAPLKGRA